MSERYPCVRRCRVLVILARGCQFLCGSLVTLLVGLYWSFRTDFCWYLVKAAKAAAYGIVYTLLPSAVFTAKSVH